MAIPLPFDPAPTDHKPFLISFAQDNEPFLGGDQMRVLRPGTRMGCSFVMPKMKYATAMAWIARLLQSEGQTVRMRYRQQDFVNGKANSTISAAVAANAYTVALANGNGNIAEGQAFSIVYGDGHYSLHFFTGTNGGSINLYPALRKPLVGGESVNFTDPMIEGLLTSSVEWSMDKALTTGLSFEIRENR